jgi:hypothetical protein
MDDVNLARAQNLKHNVALALHRVHRGEGRQARIGARSMRESARHARADAATPRAAPLRRHALTHNNNSPAAMRRAT